MQLKRMLCDVETVGGVLQPGSAWRLEMAKGETAVHRRFVLLEHDDDDAIARFASRFGLLRLAAAEVVHARREAYWQEQAHRMGQAREDDIEKALVWVRDPRLPYPDESDDILKLVDAFANAIPEADLRAMAAFVGDRPWAEVHAMLDVAKRYGDMPALSLSDLFAPVERDVGRPAPSARLRAALGVVQVFGQKLARDNGLEDRPHSPSFGGMLAGFIAAVPMPGDVASAPERTDEWRALASLISEWIELVDLLRRSESDGVLPHERQRLTALLDQRVEWKPPPGRYLAEVADLATPVVRSRVEQALTYAGAWPPSSAGPTPLYARILLRLWRDLTGEPWPKRCAELGCVSALPAHRKNALCPMHAAERQRRRVARRRAGRGPRRAATLPATPTAGGS